MTRRELLNAIGACAAAGLSGACGPKRLMSSIPAMSQRGLVPVECSSGRVIRTVAGLRPYRPSGYVVRTDRIQGKTVIHHYGHGGAGITLSWGTAHLAAEEAQKSGHQEFAVIGCGVIGLTTARTFQRRGYSVTIYAKDTPPNTTSNIAGGWWSPVTLYESGKQGPEFSATFVQAATFAHRYYQTLTNDYYGVRWIPMYSLSDEQPRPGSTTHPFPEIQALFPERRELSRDEHPFPTPYVNRSWSMLIEPPIYLNALLRDYFLAGGKLVIRDFPNVEALLALKEPAIVNCTGLGAKALFQDEELTPVKGQLSVLIPQPEVDYCTVGPGSLYMFPRRDGILLGGTHEEGVWSTEPDPAEARRIVEGHATIFRGMRRS
jgi:D-amino-acid oxidase